jgi:putative effector of murein hydrolase
MGPWRTERTSTSSSRAFAVDPVAGVFAGLPMGLNAIVTPAVTPALLPWLIG